MPDTYKTFLSPGSCQLEVTDLVASANDDKGVDLYGVAWEIEQVLIAGEGFAASPTDVWVNERGILNVGKSLFDKINRTAEDNDNIPGQCTVVVKATSLVDSSKVARLKVLVGYPGEGGGGGGGTVEVPIIEKWNDSVLTTAYFTAKNSAGESITPVFHEEGDAKYFTIEVEVGSVVTLESIDSSIYTFNSNNTVYLIDEQQGGGYVFAPITVKRSSVELVAVNNTSYPYARLMLSVAIGGGND